MRRRRSPLVKQLLALQEGESALLKYKGRTPFSVWIALQRQRLKQAFVWKAPPGRAGHYEVTVPGVLQPKLPIASMAEWYNPKLDPGTKKRAIAALRIYDFAPRKGKGGALLQQACIEAGVSRTRGCRWTAAVMRNTSFLDRQETDFRTFLASLVKAVEGSNEAQFTAKVFEKLKMGYVVETSLNKRQRGHFESCLKPRFDSLHITPSECGVRACYRISGVLK